MGVCLLGSGVWLISGVNEADFTQHSQHKSTAYMIGTTGFILPQCPNILHKPSSVLLINLLNFSSINQSLANLPASKTKQQTSNPTTTGITDLKFPVTSSHTYILLRIVNGSTTPEPTFKSLRRLGPLRLPGLRNRLHNPLLSKR